MASTGALRCAGYVNDLTHGRFGDMSKGEKFGTAAGGLALAGILYEVSALGADTTLRLPLHVPCHSWRLEGSCRAGLRT